MESVVVHSIVPPLLWLPLHDSKGSPFVKTANITKISSSATGLHHSQSHHTYSQKRLIISLRSYNYLGHSRSSLHCNVCDPPSCSNATTTKEWAMQDFYTLRKEVEVTSHRVEEIRAAAGLQQREEVIASLEAAAADSSLWDDHAKAQQTLQALTDCKEKLKLLDDFMSQVGDAEMIIKLTEEMESIDTGLLEEAAGIIKGLNKAMDHFELTQLLSGPYDKEGAIVTITAGAGGTDAQCRTGLRCFSGCM
ncbi:unnamed protein product [Cuscuta epithymum]|uniref:Peptide chain release factor domain-containing protein n=1 Tax=Cuscuta epithymum TaxID=186058 RepID=A0AAV0FQI7_9ASTE|nr:unnamed protein product [Cuscuta epithymum]